MFAEIRAMSIPDRIEWHCVCALTSVGTAQTAGLMKNRQVCAFKSNANAQTGRKTKQEVPKGGERND